MANRIRRYHLSTLKEMPSWKVLIGDIEYANPIHIVDVPGNVREVMETSGPAYIWKEQGKVYVAFFKNNSDCIGDLFIGSFWSDRHGYCYGTLPEQKTIGGQNEQRCEILGCEYAGV